MSKFMMIQAFSERTGISKGIRKNGFWNSKKCIDFTQENNFLKMFTIFYWHIIIIINNDNNVKKGFIMKQSKADVILHLVRMRIVQTLINGRKLTVQQLGENLQDIPQATLYRHLKRMLHAKVIEVVEENPVRGAVEKVYALPKSSGSISAEEISNWNVEEHMDSFMKFFSIVLADFERYIAQEDFDLQKVVLKVLQNLALIPTFIRVIRINIFRWSTTLWTVQASKALFSRY
ncbi:helix-turn-helix domain-containing protein [Bacillus sp. B190/17]|uniref:Helix-turn-helix domain-containing protein n=1 Tax=Bacillus lumedeiriae TaxID=3058829 RepID=A0ABW8IAS2_9BACI